MPPRYTSRPLPAYAFLPGKTPHPTRDAKGHSYKRKPEAVDRLDSDQWKACEAYLYGVDLFNAGYFWEAHETWEALWKMEPPASDVSLFLQGLIQIAAALLKEEGGNSEGRERLLRNGVSKLESLGQKNSAPYCGVNLNEYLKSENYDLLSLA